MPESVLAAVAAAADLATAPTNDVIAAAAAASATQTIQSPAPADAAQPAVAAPATAPALTAAAALELAALALPSASAQLTELASAAGGDEAAYRAVCLKVAAGGSKDTVLTTSAPTQAVTKPDEKKVDTAIPSADSVYATRAQAMAG